MKLLKIQYTNHKPKGDTTPPEVLEKTVEPLGLIEDDLYGEGNSIFVRAFEPSSELFLLIPFQNISKVSQA